MKNQTTPLSEKILDTNRSGQVRSGQVRSGQVKSSQVRTFYFLIENIVPSGIPGTVHSPFHMDRNGA